MVYIHVASSTGKARTHTATLCPLHRPPALRRMLSHAGQQGSRTAHGPASTATPCIPFPTSLFRTTLWRQAVSVASPGACVATSRSDLFHPPGLHLCFS